MSSFAGASQVDKAIEYVRRGWGVVALHHVRPDGSCSCHPAGQACRSGKHGKHPIEPRWQARPKLSIPDVYSTWEEHPDANVGIATGAASGIFVLDVDPKDDGHLRLAELEAEHGTLPTTYTVRTGSGGRQYYFLMPDFPVTNATGALPHGIDIRGTGGQVVAPPSITGRGPVYDDAGHLIEAEALHRGPYTVLIDADPVPAPTWLLDAIRPKPRGEIVPIDLDNMPSITDVEPAEAERLGRVLRGALKGELGRLVQCQQLATANGGGYTGERWERTTFEVAANLIELANSPWNPLTLAQAYTLLQEYAPRDAGWTANDIDEKWRTTLARISAKPATEQVKPYPAKREIEADPVFGAVLAEGAARIRAAQTEGGEDGTPAMLPRREWDDLGNAARVVDSHGGELLWIEQAKEWAVYRHGVWHFDEALGQAMIQELIAGLPDSSEAGQYDEEGREGFRKWARKQRSTSKVNAATSAAKRVRVLQGRMDEFDRDPMLLNVANGVVDLRTGELLAHDPALRLMQQAPVRYNPDAQCPRFAKYLDRVHPDPLMREFLARLVGYSITGTTGEQVMFLHHGPQANGKSVFLEVMGDVLGDYGQVVPRKTLLAKPDDSAIPTDVARMVGKRFMQTSETAAGRRLDEEMIKSLTGGDRQVARFLHAKEFEFKPTGKIHYVTNHLPKLTNAESIWRRLILIGWNVVIPPEERDKTLATTIIRDEAEGVLAWAVRGALEWQRDGLAVPEPCRLALQEYREAEDVLGMFLGEELMPAPDHFEPFQVLYRSYTDWAFRMGLKAGQILDGAVFSMALKERGFEDARKYADVDGKRKQVRGFIGLIPVRSALTEAERLLGMQA